MATTRAPGDRDDDAPQPQVTTHPGSSAQCHAARDHRSFRLYLHRLWFAQNECYTTENVADAIVWELPGQRKPAF